MMTSASKPHTPVNRINQRRSRRKPPKGSTRVRAYRNSMGLGPNIGLGVLDVSEIGVRLILKEALPVHQEFEIHFETVAGSKSVKVIAKVIWIVAMADGNYCVGAQLGKPLNYVDFQDFARV